MEKLGIPTVVIQRKELMGATRQAVMGQGLPPEVPWVVFPVDLFLGDSDLTPLSEKLGDIEAGLTTWKPEHTKIEMITKEPVVVKGKDYAEAYTKYQYLALQNTWSDGLPVLPPTHEKVEWLLTGVEHKGSDLVGDGTGKVAPKAGILTYEVLATCMAMAGGRPEYMPVAEAVCKTLIDSQTTMLTSSGSAFPGTVVNGPIKKQLRINSEFSLLGPNPAYPAGTAIGRCVWLVLMNVGGHVAGQGSIGQYGEMRFTGVCFAEDEDNLPKGWNTFAEEYYQRAKGTNSATFFFSFLGGLRPFVHRGPGDDPSFEIEMEESFLRARNAMRTIGTNAYAPQPGSPGLLLYNSLIANNMANIGWTKEKIKKHLAELNYVHKAELEDRTDVKRAAEKAKADWASVPAKIPLMTDEKNINLVVAGGDHASAAMWIGAITKLGNNEIVLPKNWDALLKQAEADLGPNPDL